MSPCTCSRFVLVSLVASVLAACSGAPEAGKDNKAAAVADGSGAAKAAGPALTGAPAAVDGVATWSDNRDAGYTVSVPSGADWVVEKQGTATAVHSDKLDVTIMLQFQSGIEADRLDEFVTMIVDSNKRDAPKYSAKPIEKGSVAGNPGARVDGEFDNGTAYATRDYMMMSPKGANAVMVRGPKQDAARVQAIADHVAATFVP